MTHTRKLTLLALCALFCVASAGNFAEDTQHIQAVHVPKDYPGKPDDHYLRIGVKRSHVAAACAPADKGKNRATYIPLQFKDGSKRIIKPHSKNSCTEGNTRSANNKMEMQFELLDSAQTGHVICAASQTDCAVFLYNHTAPGFVREGYSGVSNSGRKLMQGTCTQNKQGGYCSCTTIGCNGCCNYSGYPGCCNSGCQSCKSSGSTCTCLAPSQPPGCFPADALVTLASGLTKLMAEVRIGDKVLSVRTDGTTFFDDVYMFGHKATTATASFVKLDTASGKSLRLTPDHYVLVVRSGKREIIASAEAKVGYLIHITAGKDTAVLEAIAKTSIIQDAGLLNPYTLEGTIVVDGVAASSHSSSALDGVFNAMHISIPVGYQALFAPVRVLYRTVGPKAMRFVEPVMDSVAAVMNGEVSLVPTVGVMAGAAALLASRKRVAV